MKKSPIKDMAYWKGKNQSTPLKFMPGLIGTVNSTKNVMGAVQNKPGKNVIAQKIDEKVEEKVENVVNQDTNEGLE